MRYVRYVGLAHVRMLTAADWRSVGINGETAVWNAQNGFAVPLDFFTEDQIAKGIDADPELIITGDDEDFEPQPVNRDVTPSMARQIVENPVDVPGMLDGAERASTTGSGPTPGGGSGTPTTVATGRGSGHDES